MARAHPFPPPAARSPGADIGDPALRRLLLDIETRRNRAHRRLLAARMDATARHGRKPIRADTDASAAEAGPPSPPVAAAGSAPGTVLALRRVADDLVSFRLARPAGFDYAPGNSVRLTVDGVERPYSMVSAPHEPDLEFFVELLPNGRMAAKLARLREGQRIGIAGRAKRGLSLDGTARRHLMLATVTGVNPFVSLLRDAVHRGLRDLHCILVHGASYADEFGYRDELEALAAARPDLLRYIPTVSRPAEPRNAGWQRSTGRADILIEPVLRKYGLTPDDTAAYACGNPGMVDAARARLAALGYRVHTERYT